MDINDKKKKLMSVYRITAVSVGIGLLSTAVVVTVVLVITRCALKRAFTFAKTGVSLHMMRFPSWYSGDFPEAEFPPSPRYREIFYNRVKIGYNNMKRSKIVITGLARDIAKSLHKNLARLIQIGTKFDEYRILIFENDSSDATREIILQKSISNPNIELVKCPEEENCKLNMNKAVDDGIISVGRFTKMAGFRNRYLDTIRQNYSHFDHFMVVDLDLSGPISIDGLATCFCFEGWHAMSAMGLVSRPLSRGQSLSYYDSLAYVPYGKTPQGIVVTYDLICKDANYFQQLSHYIKTFMKKVPPREGKPELVASGFAGCCVYKLQPFIDCKDLYYTGEHCEHVTLHQRMKEKGYGNIYINPAFVLLHSISASVSKTSKNAFEKLIGM